ncbi:MAG: pyridoxamine 5'-phosphate oxidase family protein [Nitrososphaerales archaeon]
MLTKVEREYLASHDICRLATATKKGVPQVSPVMYAIDKEKIIIATDYGTIKLRNLRENPVASLVVDDYDPNSGIILRGSCNIIERGSEYLDLLQILLKRFEYYRANPWSEGEAPILEITANKVKSWGL